MDPKDARTALARQLQAEISSARRMLEILKEEQQALKNQDLPAMEKATQAKLAHHESWESLDARRNELLLAAGFTADRDGLAACIAWCDEGEGLDDLWQLLASLLESCRRLNRANGMTIEVCHRQVGEALAILHGRPGGAPSVYDSSGTPAAAAEGRSLGSA